MNDTKTITLESPIQRGEQTITTVTVRKPNTGALRGVSLTNLLQLEVAAIATVLPRITDPVLTPQDINNLDPADLVQLGGEVAGFLLPKAAKEAFQSA